mmetsp:Transcript_16860/g.20580  ORF Transcript_16860/g.20580 Transcript_16860/m.20580 type:complete len:1144 (-) Transcript_16860:2555-5986(-)
MVETRKGKGCFIPTSAENSFKKSTSRTSPRNRRESIKNMADGVRSQHERKSENDNKKVANNVKNYGKKQAVATGNDADDESNDSNDPHSESEEEESLPARDGAVGKNATLKKNGNSKNSENTGGGRVNPFVREFNILDCEMELAERPTNSKGRLRKKMSKEMSGYRTQKRKILENNDRIESAIKLEEDVFSDSEKGGSTSVAKKQRIRGSMKALELGDDAADFASFLLDDNNEKGGADGKEHAPLISNEVDSRKEDSTPKDNNATSNVGIQAMPCKSADMKIKEEHDTIVRHVKYEDELIKELEMEENVINLLSDTEDEESDNDVIYLKDVFCLFDDDSNEEDDGKDDGKEDEPNTEMFCPSNGDINAKVNRSSQEAIQTKIGGNPAEKTRDYQTGEHHANTMPLEGENQTETFKKWKKNYGARKQIRSMYRLKSFSSQRLAQRHGDALGAHSRGLQRTAVLKLAEVAEAAPIAPQIYSSLGLVYENMLREEMTKKENKLTSTCDKNSDNVGIGLCPSTSADNEEIANDAQSFIFGRLALVKKAYGSYYVAAILCKKDFTLWVRAGDAAIEIAYLYEEAMLHCTDTSGCGTSESIAVIEREKFRDEKRKWVKQAKLDYEAADKLQPPGISVPAKLASAHMQLGNLSNALTILTDMKNSTAAQSSKKTVAWRTRKINNPNLRDRSELEKSYGAWMLYADLMLKVGHTCTKYNKGFEASNNYIYKRWLKKYSKSFDWRERRLQALCLALEAAAGTRCCENLIKWSRKRAKESMDKIGKKGSVEEGRWQVDNFETDMSTIRIDELEKKDSSINNKDGKSPENQLDTGDETVAGEITKKSIENAVDIDIYVDGESEIAPLVVPSIDLTDGRTCDMRLSPPSEAAFESKILIATNNEEVHDFDNETYNLSDKLDSAAAVDRPKKREALLRKHRESVLNFARSFYQAMQSTKQNILSIEKSLKEPLPIAASISTVYEIASQLMKHCLGLKHFYGGCMDAKSVSTYLRERAKRCIWRIEELRKFYKEDQKRKEEEKLELCIEKHDMVNDCSDSDEDDENQIILSDDEKMDRVDNKGILNTMEIGSLPPEIRVLYALCLIGDGGKDFIAWKLLQSYEYLNDDDISSEKCIIDAEIITDPTWINFCRATIEA